MLNRCKLGIERYEKVLKTGVNSRLQKNFCFFCLFDVLLLIFGLNGIFSEEDYYIEDSFSKEEYLRTKESPVQIYDIETQKWASLSDDYKKARDRLENFKTEFGRAPNLDDYYKILLSDEFELTRDDQSFLWNTLRFTQNPSLSKKDLVKIFQMKKNSIKDLYASFVVKTGNEPHDTSEYVFALKNKMRYLDKRGAYSATGSYRELVSLGNSYFRKVWFLSPVANASIRQKNGEMNNVFLCLQMPLAASLLCDKSIFDFEIDRGDLCTLLGKQPSFQIMEQSAIIDGNECLVLASPNTEIFLDISKDFSVCLIKCYRDNAHDGKAASSRYLSYERVFHHLTDYGNGIWLPVSIETTMYEPDHRLKSHEIVEYGEIKINVGLDSNFFEDVIPDGAMVTDSIRDMVYRWGDHPSIGSLIKETVKSKRQTIFRNLSVVCGLCFLACWGFIEWRKRRLLKENTE